MNRDQFHPDAPAAGRKVWVLAQVLLIMLASHVALMGKAGREAQSSRALHFHFEGCRFEARVMK